MFLAEIVFATVVALKKGGFKVKLHLKDAISQLKNGEEVVSKDIFIFPTQLIEAFAANVPMDIMRLTPTQLAAALRGAKVTINVTLSDDEEFTNFSIDKMMLSDVGIEMLAEDGIMAVLDAKSRERRAERNAAKAASAAKAAMAAMAAEFAAIEEPAKTADEPSPMQVLAEAVNAEILAEAEAKVAAAEAAYAADPTPGKKGAVTKAKKALAALQA